MSTIITIVTKFDKLFHKVISKICNFFTVYT